MNYNDRTFIKTILCIFAFIYFGLVDAAKRGFKWLAELLFAVALLFSLPARADAPLIWGSSGPQLIQSGALTAKDGSVYPKYYEKNYLAAGASSVGAAASPVWNASGAGITCTTTVTNLPDASVGTALAVTGQSGAAGTEYCFYNFDIDQADGSKVLKLVEDQLPISGYVASDFRLDVYSCTVAWSGTPATTCSGTATRLALSTDNSSGVTALPALTGTLTPPPTYSTPAYASAPHLQARIGLNGASTHQMNFAQVLTGPGTMVQSAAVGPTQTYSPVITASTPPTEGTGVTKVASWHQDGEFMLLHYDYTQTGTGAAGSGTYLFPLPAGYTVDTNFYGGIGSSNAVVGSAAANDGSKNYTGTVNVADASHLYLLVGNETITPQAISSGFNAVSVAEKYSFEARVKIAEWAGQGTVFLGQGTPAYYYCTGGTWGTSATCTTQQGQGGVLGGTTTPTAGFTYTFTPAYPVPVGVTPILQVSTNQVNWSNVPSSTTPEVEIESLRYDGTNYIGAAANVNSSGNIVATFGKYATGTSSAWSGTWYWRVFVGYPGQATGFAAASATAPGLVSYEDSGTFTASFTGPRSTSDTITYSRVGKTVTLLFPSDASGSCTSGTHFTASGVIPSALRPATQAPTAAIPVRDNTSDLAAMGGVNVTTGGNILINANEASANFTGSGTCGWYSGVITYPVN